MVYPSLFLYFFRRLVFPCSYLIGGTIPTFLLPFIYRYIYIFNSIGVHHVLWTLGQAVPHSTIQAYIDEGINIVKAVERREMHKKV